MRKFIQFFTVIVITLRATISAFAAEPIATGTFGKGSTHGSVKIEQRNGEWILTFGDDFFHEGSPDPWVALGKDGFQRSGIIGELKQFKGTHSLVIEKLNPQDFNEVYVWCVEHNSSLGRAMLVWE